MPIKLQKVLIDLMNNKNKIDLYQKKAWDNFKLSSEASSKKLDEYRKFVFKNKLSLMGYPEVGDANTIIHKAKSFVSCATGRMTSESE